MLTNKVHSLKKERQEREKRIESIFCAELTFTELGSKNMRLSLTLKFWHYFSFQASCKLLAFIQMYIMSCNYFWMLCEGIYLHTLIVVAVFAEKQHLIWYHMLGWGK